MMPTEIIAQYIKTNCYKEEKERFPGLDIALEVMSTGASTDNQFVSFIISTLCKKYEPVYIKDEFALLCSKRGVNEDSGSGKSGSQTTRI